jgi:ankyrin repeat protein/curved DNA-binding protein CbpA
VLKCHPDRCQDEALRAKAADMFHRVQRSYEILVDKRERTRYDNQIRLAELKTEQLAKSGTRNPGLSTPGVVEMTEWKKEERRKGRVELRRPTTSFTGMQEKGDKGRAQARRPTTSYIGRQEKKSSDDRLPVLRAATVSHIQKKTNNDRSSVHRASTSAYDNQRKTKGEDQALLSRMRVDEVPDVSIQNTKVGIPMVLNLPRWYSCKTCSRNFTYASKLRSHSCGRFRCQSFGCAEGFRDPEMLRHHLKSCKHNPLPDISALQPTFNEPEFSPSSRSHSSISSLPLRQNKEERTTARYGGQRQYLNHSQTYPGLEYNTAPHLPLALSDPTPYGFSSKRQRHTPGHSSTRYMIVEPDSDCENPSVVRQIQPKGSEKIESANKGDGRFAKEEHKRANDHALSWSNPTPKPFTAFPDPLLPDVPLLKHGSGKRSRYLSSSLTAATGLHDQRIDREDNCAIDARNPSTNPANNALKALMGVQNVVVPALKPRKEQRIAADPAMPNYIPSEELTQPARNVSTLESWDDLMKTAKLQRDLEGVNDREARESISSAISTHKIDATDAKSWTALHHATGNGIDSAVDWLLRKGADIHYRTETGYEPLHVAIEREQLSTMRILLEHGANFNGKGRSKGVSDIITPIELAVSKNKEPLVRLLLQHAKKSTLINEQYALRWAAEYGDFDIVRLLLEHGADPNSSNDDYCGNALHGACKKGRAEVVRLLLEYKANTGAKAFYDHIVKYRTAMYIAQKEGHESVVAQLQLVGVELSPEIPSKDPGKPRRTFRDRMQIVNKLSQVPESAQSNVQTTKAGLTESQGSGTRTTAKARSTTLAMKRRNVGSISGNFVLLLMSHLQAGTTSDLKDSKDYPVQRSEIKSEANISIRGYSTNCRGQVSTVETIVHDSSPRQRTDLEPTAGINADAACEMEFVGSESSRMSSSCLPMISKVQEARENNDPPSESTETSESSFSGSDHSDEDGCHIVSWKMQELIERIMTEFYSLFLPRWTQNGTGQVKCAHGSKSGQNCGHIHSKTASASPSKAADSSAGKSLLKRAMNDRDWPSGDSEDEDRKRPKPLPAPRGEGVHARKFACPFFKFDPKVFSKYGSCTGPGFKSVSRVKYVRS